MTSDDVARAAEIRARADAATDENSTTPEQRARARCERIQSDTYEDGRPKYHRHLAQYAIHTDAECNVGIGGTSRRRVYVFDDDYIDEYDRFIAEREREDVPWLLDRLAAETAEVERLREELDHEQPDDHRALASLADDQADQIAALTARLAAETERARQLTAANEGFAKVLDQVQTERDAETERADKAETAVERVRDAAAQWSAHCTCECNECLTFIDAMRRPTGVTSDDVARAAEIRARADAATDRPSGCCTGCDGTGLTSDPETGGRCWDCRGTGHCHDIDEDLYCRLAAERDAALDRLAAETERADKAEADVRADERAKVLAIALAAIEEIACSDGQWTYAAETVKYRIGNAIVRALGEVTG